MLFYLWMACTLHSKSYYGLLLCNIRLFWWWTIIYMCIYFPNWLILFYGHLAMAYFFSPLSAKCTARHKEMGPIQTANEMWWASCWCSVLYACFLFFPQGSVFSRLFLQNTKPCFFICACAQRQRLRGSRKEKMYKDNIFGSLAVKSRASAGIFSWSFQQNFCCDREQRSNRTVRILLLRVSIHLSNWKKKKKKQSKTKKAPGLVWHQRRIMKEIKNCIGSEFSNLFLMNCMHFFP